MPPMMPTVPTIIPTMQTVRTTTEIEFNFTMNTTKKRNETLMDTTTEEDQLMEFWWN